MPDKAEYPPLLGAGLHRMTVGALRRLCVSRFPHSRIRRDILDGLIKVIDEIEKTGLEADLWVDGSFLTHKESPEDSDVVLRVSGSTGSQLSPEQYKLLQWLGTDLKSQYLCDSYVLIEYESGHPSEALGQQMRAYWLKWFGRSRRGEEKGIAVIEINR